MCDAGDVIDSSRGGDPLEYLHGEGGIVPGLERALSGKAAGDALQVTIPPADGYGEPTGPGPQSVPRDAFPDDVDLEVGMQFFAPGPAGRPVPVWITEIHDGHVAVDINHPLAGASLHFEVEVVAIRDATEDELDHGHPHGPDGHGHHHH